MISSEIKETIYIAIGLITVAFVLLLVSFGYSLRSQMADIQNEQRIVQYMTKAKNKFEKYHDTVIYGEDVVALIHEYTDDIMFYIDDLKLADGSNLTDVLIDSNGDTSINTKIRYSSTPIFKGYNEIYLGLEDASAGAKYPVDSEKTYYCYLVFDAYDVNSMSSYKYTPSNGDYTQVSGIIIKYVGDGKHIYIRDISGRDNISATTECGCYITYKKKNNIETDKEAKEKCDCPALEFSKKINMQLKK